MSAGQRGLDPATPLAPTATGLILLQELRAGSVVAERFRIERILGIGGMGLVYQARDLELDVDVALKQLRPELAARTDAFERFRKELLLARSVSSPHVVRIHDLVRHEQTWLISMDYVPGRSLERLLQEEQRLDPERALAITRQIALGLAAAHDSGVVHRDLKPANILIDDADQTRITDFGVARAAGDTGITGSGVVIGTPEYLSPEQARAEALDGRSDLYALGLILFEMLTGTLPFRGGTPAEMMIQRVVQSPPKADTIRDDLPSFAVELTARLLSLDPTDRPSNGSEVVAAIDRGDIKPIATKTQIQPHERKGWVLGVVLVALTAAAGFLAWRPDVSPPVIDASAAAPLDLVPLPWSVDSADANDQRLAQAVWYLLGSQLVMDPALYSADPLRVRRVLDELGFDAIAADRQHDRVLEVTGAGALLEGDWDRQESGISIKLRLLAAGQSSPVWSWQGQLETESDLPTAFASMVPALSEALRLTTGKAAGASLLGWQGIGSARTLTDVGLLLDSDLGVDGSLDQLDILTLPPPAQGLLLNRLERLGLTARAATVARVALDRTAVTPSDPLESRTRAHAMLLVGDAAAMELLQGLVKEYPHDVEARRLLARAQAEAGQFGKALQTLQAVLREDPGNGRAWFELARYTLQDGDTKRAVDEYLVRAQVLANRHEDAWLQADVANALGVGYYRLGQLDAATETLLRALDLGRKLGDRRGQAATLSNLSIVHSVQGQLIAAREFLDQARLLIEPLGDALALADLTNDLGLLAEEEGDYTRALEAHRESLTLRQAQGAVRDVVESLLNVGHVYFQLGEFDNAQTYWEQALQRASDLDDELSRVQAQLGLGLARVAGGDWQGAREQLQDSLLVTESMQMVEEQSIALANLAELNRLEGLVTQALASAEAARALFARRGDQRGVVEMHLLKAQSYLDIGAIAAATSELQMLATTPPASAEQQGLLALRNAEVALSEGRADEALASAESAIRLATDAHAMGLELQARLTLANAWQAKGEASSAARTLRAVEAGLGRYASVPLRLLLAETQLVVDGHSSEQVWRGTQALLARLPAYGRHWRLQTLALRQSRSDEAQQRLASEIARMDGVIPAALRPVFAAEVGRWTERFAMPAKDDSQQ